MSNYRVRRDIPGNSYTQLKSADLADCKALLKSIKGKWDDLKGIGLDEEMPYSTQMMAGGKELVVTQGDRVVDRYIVEKA